jgi:hypothetical protein
VAAGFIRNRFVEQPSSAFERCPTSIHEAVTSRRVDARFCRKLAFLLNSVQLFCSWCFCSCMNIYNSVIDATNFFLALGQKVKRLREARGLTQDDMLSFQFSPRHWQQIEKGRPITVTSLLRIAAAFDISLCRLLRDLPVPLVRNSPW